jgi:hypothetical protein
VTDGPVCPIVQARPPLPIRPPVAMSEPPIEITVSPPIEGELPPPPDKPKKKYTYAIKAYKNPDFLNGNHARFIRVMCEYEVSGLEGLGRGEAWGALGWSVTSDIIIIISSSSSRALVTAILPSSHPVLQ